MEIMRNGPHLTTMSAKDPGDMSRYMEPPIPEEHFDVGIRHKEIRKNIIFSENLPNKMSLTNSPVLAVKKTTKEGKVGKWSLSNLYRMLRIWLGKHFDKRDQADGFEQMFYTGERKVIIYTFRCYLSNV